MALLALTIQLVASFGHFHHEDLFGSGQGVAVAAGAGNPASDRDADQHGRGGLCGMCWAVQLLGNAQIAVPPLLPVDSRVHAHCDLRAAAEPGDAARLSGVSIPRAAERMTPTI